jgi:hypothetical protein
MDLSMASLNLKRALWALVTRPLRVLKEARPLRVFKEARPDFGAGKLKFFQGIFFCRRQAPHGFLKRHDPYGFLKRHDPTVRPKKLSLRKLSLRKL